MFALTVNLHHVFTYACLPNGHHERRSWMRKASRRTTSRRCGQCLKLNLTHHQQLQTAAAARMVAVVAAAGVVAVPVSPLGHPGAILAQHCSQQQAIVVSRPAHVLAVQFTTR